MQEVALNNFWLEGFSSGPLECMESPIIAIINRPTGLVDPMKVPSMHETEEFDQRLDKNTYLYYNGML